MNNTLSKILLCCEKFAASAYFCEAIIAWEIFPRSLKNTIKREKIIPSEEFPIGSGFCMFRSRLICRGFDCDVLTVEVYHNLVSFYCFFR